MVKHKSTYSCESAIYFDLCIDIIKEDFNFTNYFNNTNIKPAVLYGGNKIILANCPNIKLLNVKSLMTFLLKYPATHVFC